MTQIKLFFTLALATILSANTQAQKKTTISIRLTAL